MKTAIDIIRKDLKAAARREPEHIQPFIRTLDRQLRNYAKNNAEEQAALKPQITKNIERLEKARAAGR